MELAEEVNQSWEEGGFIPDDSSVMNIFKGFIRVMGHYKSDNGACIESVVNKLETWTEGLASEGDGDCTAEREN
jgi:hypothetical protein